MSSISIVIIVRGHSLYKQSVLHLLESKDQNSELITQLWCFTLLDKMGQ